MYIFTRTAVNIQKLGKAFLSFEWFDKDSKSLGRWTTLAF